ncbi:hypothetical protein Tco_1523541, partial [Tanacetum coccineum]
MVRHNTLVRGRDPPEVIYALGFTVSDHMPVCVTSIISLQNQRRVKLKLLVDIIFFREVGETQSSHDAIISEPRALRSSFKEVANVHIKRHWWDKTSLETLKGRKETLCRIQGDVKQRVGRALRYENKLLAVFREVGETQSSHDAIISEPRALRSSFKEVANVHIKRHWWDKTSLETLKGRKETLCRIQGDVKQRLGKALRILESRQGVDHRATVYLVRGRDPPEVIYALGFTEVANVHIKRHWWDKTSLETLKGRKETLCRIQGDVKQRVGKAL